MNYKKITAGLICMAILALTACGKDESYRIIKLTDMAGEVSYTRDDETEDVYENMNFESGDEVETEKESCAQLTLDSDKILTMGAETIILLEAEGDEEESKTRIKLEEGEITCEIKNALSSGALYEVETSNATIGVRGTVFYVKERKDRTIVYCETGKVEISLNNSTSQTISAQEAVVIEDGAMTPAALIDIVDEVSVEFISDLPGLEVTEGEETSRGEAEGQVTGQDEWILVKVIEGQIKPMPETAVVIEGDTGGAYYSVTDESTGKESYYSEEGFLLREELTTEDTYSEWRYATVEGASLLTREYSRKTSGNRELLYDKAYTYGKMEYLKKTESGFAEVTEEAFHKLPYANTIAPGKGYYMNVAITTYTTIEGVPAQELDFTSGDYWIKVDVREDNTYTITVYE